MIFEADSDRDQPAVQKKVQGGKNEEWKKELWKRSEAFEYGCYSGEKIEGVSGCPNCDGWRCHVEENPVR